MKDLVLLLGYLAVVTSTCENPEVLMPEGMGNEEECGSGLETGVTSTMPELVLTATLEEPSTSVTPVTNTPPKDSSSSSVLTSGIVIIVAGCGAGSLVLVAMMVLILILCRRRFKKCRNGCPCVGRSKGLDSPIIKVTFRTSLHGDRASYYIQTYELGPTTFYTHSREDFEPSVEHNTGEDQEDPNMEEAHDKSAEISDGELHVKELDNLEKVLDSALVKFESTTL